MFQPLFIMAEKCRPDKITNIIHHNFKTQPQCVCVYIYIYIYIHTHIYIYREREREREKERERQRHSCPIKRTNSVKP